MKKDIEWLKEEANKTLRNKVAYGINYYDYIDLKNSLNEIIDQLDEPEVLSQEWIDEHEEQEEMYGTYGVPVRKLENLLVPKQEITEEQVMEWLDNNEFYCHATAETVLENAVDKGELGYYGTKYAVVEKPVIPNYIAKWISRHHERFDLYPALKRLENNALSWEDVYEWYRRNTHTFVNAYLTGKYEVEEEQKYYVLDSEEIPLLERASNQTCKTTTGLSIYEDGRDNSRFELTEQEIKDYDERYWAFAEQVERVDTND